jgi:solute:Na+ symporter, SSS family
MSALDLTLLIGLTALTLGIGLLGGRKDANSEDFLVAGRGLSWWQAGTSMVATTFAVDTPLVVAGLTAGAGVSSNWFWWGLCASHLLVTVFLAGRWQRSGCVTDAELALHRHGDGRAARALRVVRGFYFAVPINIWVLAWVLNAGGKVLAAVLPWNDWVAPETLASLSYGSLDGATLLSVVCALILGLAYGAVSGLRGVVFTDLLQFSMAMVGAIALAIYAVQAAGGTAALAGLLEAQQSGALQPADQLLMALDPLGVGGLESYAAHATHADLTAPIGDQGTMVLTMILVAWWATKNADGGGVLIQRMLACKSPRDATLAMGWFTAAHYLLRPWCWVAVGLVVAVVLPFPGHGGFEQSYADAIVSLLPDGLLGIAFAGLVAALVSTADTHLHWGASYVANDLVPQTMDDRQRLLVARAVQPLIGIAAVLIAGHMDQIAGAWKVLLVLGAGIGPPTLLRWVWWRVSAPAELIAFAASTGVAGAVLLAAPDLSYAGKLLVVGGTGLGATILGAWRWPGDRARATAFFASVRPPDGDRMGRLLYLPLLVSLGLAGWGIHEALTGSNGAIAIGAIGLITYLAIIVRLARSAEAA